MDHWNKAKREVFSDLPETCPVIAKEIGEALERLGVTKELLLENGIDRALIVPALMEIITKKGTTLLRDCWIDAVEARLVAEARVEELARELDAATSAACANP